MLKSSLKIDALVVAVHLGCTAQEREVPQEVRIHVELRFDELPRAASTDELRDSVCYAEISTAIRSYCESREFQMIEKLGFDVYRIVKEIAGSNAVAVGIHKVRPPVESLAGGTFFRCGDFDP